MRGAEFADELGDSALRDRLVARALEAAATNVELRLQIARILMTRLRDVPRGEKLVADALAAATDDEQRAVVRWFACEAIREREDLPENSYYEALEKLAKDLPATYWGAVARDRNAASQFAIGTTMFDFASTAIDGTKVASTSLRGRAVALVFCALTESGNEPLFTALATLKKQHADGLAIVVISADADASAAATAASKLAPGAPVVCDGRGLRADLLLRFHVEAVPTVVAIDRSGAIAGLNLHVETRDASLEFDEAMTRALRKSQ
jgi:peroxiredoxin